MRHEITYAPIAAKRIAGRLSRPVPFAMPSGARQVENNGGNTGRPKEYKRASGHQHDLCHTDVHFENLLPVSAVCSGLVFHAMSLSD